MLKWFWRKSAMALVALLVVGCGGLGPESADGRWTLVDVGSTGELVVVSASPWAATAVVDYRRVYDSEDGQKWSLLETPVAEPEWAGRTAKGYVVLGLGGSSATEVSGDWAECDIAADGDVLIRDGMVTHEGVFVIGSVDGKFRLWVQVPDEGCVWRPIHLSLPPNIGELSTWAEIEWTEEGLVAFPNHRVNDGPDFYWIIDPLSLDAELRTGRRHLHEVRVLSEYSGATEPEVSIETEAGLERLKLPVALQGNRHTVGPGWSDGDELMLVGSLFLDRQPGSLEIHGEVLEWTRDEDGVRVVTAASVGGFGVELYDLVEFNGIWVTGGSYVGGPDGRRPFVLVRLPTELS